MIPKRNAFMFLMFGLLLGITISYIFQGRERKERESVSCVFQGNSRTETKERERRDLIKQSLKRKQALKTLASLGMEVPTNDICILQYDTRPPQSTKNIPLEGVLPKLQMYDLSIYINYMYAEEHGYPFYYHVVDPNNFVRHPSWYKLQVIADVMKEKKDCEYIFYIDSDCYFREPEKTLEEEVLIRYSMNSSYIMLSPKDSYGDFLNAGVMFLRNSEKSLEFLKDWWNYGNNLKQKFWEHPWEQQSLIYLYNNYKKEIIKADTYHLTTPTGTFLRHLWGTSAGWEARKTFMSVVTINFLHKLESPVFATIQNHTFKVISNVTLETIE